MFDKHKLSRDGAQAQALVLEKKIYASEVESGMTSACRYQLRVKFEDGSTTEISRRVFDHTLASAAVGDVIPVRYDPADRSRIELDRHAIVERQKAQARERDAAAIARGEKALGVSLTATPSMPAADQRQPDTGNLRIGDADRELIANVLGQHMTDGRLTTEELDHRLGALYTSQTRAQARSVLAGLPPLDPSGGQRHEAVPVLPDWVSAAEPLDSPSPAPMPAGRPSGVTAPVPTDGEMNTAYRRWQAKAEKMKADKAAHKQAEASGDPRETAGALMKLTISRGEQKSARAKFDQLRERRPDWTAGEG
jgi:Domain of unknown function (DUF1707)